MQLPSKAAAVSAPGPWTTDTRAPTRALNCALMGARATPLARQIVNGETERA